jgi:hypothetical protein
LTTIISAQKEWDNKQLQDPEEIKKTAASAIGQNRIKQLLESIFQKVSRRGYMFGD